MQGWFPYLQMSYTVIGMELVLMYSIGCSGCRVDNLWPLPGSRREASYGIVVLYKSVHACSSHAMLRTAYVEGGREGGKQICNNSSLTMCSTSSSAGLPSFW